jgi:PhzF family phenazine biosynthesis protein
MAIEEVKTRSRRFIQCDVFSPVPVKGNGLAAVLDGDGLSHDQMQAFAAWTNLAETTFVQTPTSAEADYRLKIFTPTDEMLFAGHPTLGSCAAWLHAGGKPKNVDRVKQECGIGIVDIDLNGTVPAFAAPATLVEDMSAEKFAAISSALNLSEGKILASAQLTNGPVWQVFELVSAAEVLAADAAKIKYPEFAGVGLIGAHPSGSECQYEVRMLGASGMNEDPITGSLNAALARWKYDTGRWNEPVKVAQGTKIGRHGRVFLHQRDGEVWVGGQTHILIEGYLEL